MKVGDSVISGETGVPVSPGNAMPLKAVPVGMLVHNIEMKPGKGGQLGRSAGCQVQLVGRNDEFAQLKLPSGERRVVPVDCFATMGVLSNPDRMNQNLGKAR